MPTFSSGDTHTGDFIQDDQMAIEDVLLRRRAFLFSLLARTASTTGPYKRRSPCNETGTSE